MWNFNSDDNEKQYIIVKCIKIMWNITRIVRVIRWVLSPFQCIQSRIFNLYLYTKLYVQCPIVK